MKYLHLLFFCFTISAFAQKKFELKDGDLIFQDLDCGPLCDAIKAVTQGYQGNNFSHMGMVVHRNDTLFIIEAAGKAVRLNTLDNFILNTSKPLYVGRLKQQHQKLIAPAVAFSLKQIGILYDTEYVYNNGSYYCSELIYDAFKEANKGKPFFELQPMTYKKPGTNDFFPAWVDYYKQIGKPIPEGLPGCNPGGISTSSKIEIIGKI